MPLLLHTGVGPLVPTAVGLQVSAVLDWVIPPLLHWLTTTVPADTDGVPTGAGDDKFPRRREVNNEAAG